MRDKTEQSGSFRYKSPFTGEFVQVHQYIGELLTDRQARKEYVQLPYKYWINNEKWSKILAKNISLVGRYLQKYSSKAILDVLHKEKWCYSIIPLIPKIKIQQGILDKEEAKEKKETKVDTPVNEYNFAPRKKGLLGKLNGKNKRED